MEVMSRKSFSEVGPKYLDTAATTTTTTTRPRCSVNVEKILHSNLVGKQVPSDKIARTAETVLEFIVPHLGSSSLREFLSSSIEHTEDITPAPASSSAARIFRGIDIVDGKRVVVKEIPRLADGLGEVAMHILAQMDNPHVVKIIEVHVIDSGASPSSYGGAYRSGVSARGPRCAVVMEDVDGVDLLCVSKESDVPGSLEGGLMGLPGFGTKQMFLQMLNGLHAVHLNGIAHNDIKPENFILSRQDPENPRAMLIDFGNATFAFKQGRFDGSPSAAATAEYKETRTPITAHTLTCTLQYAAPEVVRTYTGKVSGFDYRADNFSLGMTFCVLLLQALPYSSFLTRPMFSMLSRSELGKMEKIAVEYECALFDPWKGDMFDFLVSFFQIKPKYRTTLPEALEHAALRPASDQRGK